MEQSHYTQLKSYYNRAIDKNYQQYIKEDQRLKQKLQELLVILNYKQDNNG